MADGESEFGVLTGILSSRKIVPRKMWRYTENGDELSGDNSRVNCIKKDILNTGTVYLCRRRK